MSYSAVFFYSFSFSDILKKFLYFFSNFTTVVQSLSCPLFVTIWTAICQASLSFISLSLLKLMSIESAMSSNHLILCHPRLLLPSIFPSIRVFSIESCLCIRWPKYWSFSFSISPFNWVVWFPCCPRDSQVFSSTTVQRNQLFSAQPSLCSNSNIHTWLLEKSSFEMDLCPQSDVTAF